MDVLSFILLAVGAFCLGACPFSLWVGRFLLGEDIRDYGDGNPGAANVFRAGGRRAGCIAAMLDVAKGMPFVVLAHSVFALSEMAVATVGVSAILGSGFSPLLHFRGGKSIAITYGVLLALPYPEICLSFAIFMLVGFLFMKTDSWIVMTGPTGSLGFLVTTSASYWELLFMLSVLVILAVKHHNELRKPPEFEVRILNWFHLRRDKV